MGSISYPGYRFQAFPGQDGGTKNPLGRDWPQEDTRVRVRVFLAKGQYQEAVLLFRVI